MAELTFAADVYEQRSHDQRTRLLRVRDQREQPLLLLPEVAHRLVGEEA